MLRNLLVAISIMLSSVILLSITAEAQDPERDNQWTDDFDITNYTFSSTGVNTYFKLLPDYQVVLEGTDDGDSKRLEITVLNRTEEVSGIETRVVEERESVNGELVEISRNFFAFCEDNGSVFYFGEDVDIYEKGSVVGHDGSWRAGKDGARPGLMMPGMILFGASYYQELAPGLAMDRARIVNGDTTYTTPAGTFDHCIVTEETSAIEPNAREYKVYARGVGLIKDETLLLTSYGMIDE